MEEEKFYDHHLQQNQSEHLAHIRDTVTLESKQLDLLLNRTIKELRFSPQGTQNTTECYPAEQATLLPYLTEERVREKTLMGRYKRGATFKDFVEIGADGLALPADAIPREPTGHLVNNFQDQGAMFMNPRVQWNELLWHHEPNRTFAQMHSMPMNLSLSTI